MSPTVKDKFTIIDLNGWGMIERRSVNVYKKYLWVVFGVLQIKKQNVGKELEKQHRENSQCYRGVHELKHGRNMDRNYEQVS